MAQVAMICSGKGGVGKSTMTCFLGRALAAMGQRVLMIEFDRGLRSLDTMAGLSEQVLFHLGDVLDGRCESGDALLTVKATPNLQLICAPASVDARLNQRVLSGWIIGLRNYYDFILLDAPAGLGEVFCICSNICDLALVVVTPDKICTRDAAITADMLRDADRPGRLIINQFSPKLFKKSGFATLDDVIDEVGLQLIGVVEHSDNLAVAAHSGLTLSEGRIKEEIDDIACRLQGQDIPLKTNFS